MSGTIGSPTTDIVSDGLVFNVDATKRASVLKPFDDPLNVYNIIDPAFAAGICSTTGLTSYIDDGSIVLPNPIPNYPTVNNNWVKFTDMSSLSLSGSHSSDFVIYNSNQFGVVSWPGVYNRGPQSSSFGYWWVYLTDGGGPDNIFWQQSYTTGIDSIGTATGITRDAYTHVIMTIDYENLEFNIYLNGALTNTQPLIATIRNVFYNPLYIGTYDGDDPSPYLGGERYGFEGRIPILRFYSRVLNQDEVTQNFNAIKYTYGL